jgi:hypothetical protein
MKAVYRRPAERRFTAPHQFSSLKIASITPLALAILLFSAFAKLPAQPPESSAEVSIMLKGHLKTGQPTSYAAARFGSTARDGTVD